MIDLEVIQKAYGWSVDCDGQVQGLTAGDMGYEPTGIFIPIEELISFAVDNEHVKMQDTPAYKAGYEAGLADFREITESRLSRNYRKT